MNVNVNGKIEYFQASAQAIEASKLRPTVLMYALDNKEVYMGGKLLGNDVLPTDIPTKVSQLENDSGYLTQHQSLSGYATETWVGQQNYENKVNIVAASDTTLAASANTYYRFDSAVSSLEVTLPEMTDTAHVSSIILCFTTSASPSITISAPSGVTVSYFDGYKIEGSKSYELNIMWNGSKWIVAYGLI